MTSQKFLEANPDRMLSDREKKARVNTRRAKTAVEFLNCGFPPQSEDVSESQIGNSKLAAGASASADGCLSFYKLRLTGGSSRVKPRLPPENSWGRLQHPDGRGSAHRNWLDGRQGGNITSLHFQRSDFNAN